MEHGCSGEGAPSSVRKHRTREDMPSGAAPAVVWSPDGAVMSQELRSVIHWILILAFRDFIRFYHSPA